jgi:diguanylate cyclase (GGDEF)-like protein
VLLSADELAPGYRWRLVHSLFAQRRSLVEGSVALAAVEAVCFARTGWRGFAVLVAAALLVLWWRIAMEQVFRRAMRRAGAKSLHAPEYWARRFTVGAMAFAAVWGLTELCVLLRFADPVMQMFVIMVQAAWLTGAMVRNAAAPAASAAQCWLSVLPTVVGTLLAHRGFVQIVAPFCLVQIGATLTIARFTGTQITRLMLSEQRLEAANARLTELSATDGLTGIGNRRAFDTTLQTEWVRAMRDATDLALLVIDVDHFKSFNDRYGHPAGDECLRLVADVTERTLRRPPDFAARFGGEEFVALLPGTDMAGAREVAERVRLAVLGASVPHEGNPLGRVTVSIGAASMAPRPGDAARTLIDLADRALYSAKQLGRNQVRTVGDGLEMPAWLPEPAGSAQQHLQAEMEAVATGNEKLV